MSIFSSGSGVGVTVAAGVVIVGAAAWVQFGGQDAFAPAPEQAAVVAPDQKAPTPAVQPQAKPPGRAAKPEASVTAPGVPPQAAIATPEPETEPEATAAVTVPKIEQPPATPIAPDVAVSASQDTAPAADEQPATPKETVPEETVQEETVQAETVQAEGVQVARPGPSFDEVRRETDGMTVIAGSAAPGASVQVLLDGVEIAQTTADGRGKFAAIAFIAADGKGHVLELLQGAGGEDEASADQIILAPLSAPVVASVAEPSPAPGTTETASAAAGTPQPDTPQPDTPLTGTAPATQEIAAADPAPEVPAQAVPAQSTSPTTSNATSDATSEAAQAPQAAEAPQEVAVLKATEQGVELLNVPRPEAMENVALDTISYSEEGDVQLAGRAQSDTRSVRVYLDNDAVINLPVDEAGRWRGDLPNVDEGIYTLRVDEISQAGKITSRVETPFKREDPAVLAEAAAAEEGPLKQITVQQGATLWGIAQDRYGDGLLFVNVFNANTDSIRDPDLIYPGQIFELPDAVAD